MSKSLILATNCRYYKTELRSYTSSASFYSAPSPQGEGFLISEFFAYDNNFDSVDMTLLSGDYKVAADSAR